MGYFISRLQREGSLRHLQLPMIRIRVAVHRSTSYEGIEQSRRPLAAMALATHAGCPRGDAVLGLLYFKRLQREDPPTFAFLLDHLASCHAPFWTNRDRWRSGSK